MLSRLLKHEWKETWKIPVLSITIILIMTLVCVICFTRMTPPPTEDAVNVGALFLFLGYSILISCVSVVLLVYIAVRFYRSLYTDEGYLMHTLPVTPSQLILSKLLVGSFWYLALSLLVIWAMLMILVFGMPVLVFEEAWTEVDLKWFPKYFNELFGMSPGAFAVFFAVLMPVSSLGSVAVTYASISLGQLFSRHKVMASVLCYFGFTMLMQTAVSIALTPWLTRLIISEAAGTADSFGIPAFMGGFMRSTLLLSLAGSAVSAAASFFISEYVMRKRLNLD